MHLQGLDWLIIIFYFLFSLAIGLWGMRRSGSSAGEFFLSGRNMPWWLLGVSMVATTFSCDTPNLVTDIVRQNGVAGNWVWWAFLLTGMLTVFVYARLWRRSGALTDLEFYEQRYSGPEAAFLRMFRAIYLGVFFNVMIMATVSLAAIKIGRILFDVSPVQTLLFTGVVTVIYAALGGFRSVLLTDFFQFILAMCGAVGAAWVVLDHPEIGGLQGLITHPNVQGKLNFWPDFGDPSAYVPLFLIPLAVQWWASWYPGAEPGGGGYVAQRMLAARNEEQAVGATLFFNVAHYALRPWPWILVALGSLIIFPTLDDLRAAFPNVEAGKIGHDLGYPAMMTLMPAGLAGVIVASLAAAYMSTIATHLNWGASYVVNDVYRRFVDPGASERRLVTVGRWTTVLLMLLSALVALALENALSAFYLLLQIGAGTGLLFILRWFWWRINAYSELAAMAASLLAAAYFRIAHARLGFAEIAEWQALLIGVGFTTLCWLLATLLSPPVARDVLLDFFKKIRPEPTGWRPVVAYGIESGELDGRDAAPGKLTAQLASMLLGCITVYGALFSVGSALYGRWAAVAAFGGVAALAALGLLGLWRRTRAS
ncbi:MAG: sodium:solute symporter family protein [Saprospiraceae bacterium]